jgi:hypothetical protein
MKILLRVRHEEICVYGLTLYLHSVLDKVDWSTSRSDSFTLQGQRPLWVPQWVWTLCKGKYMPLYTNLS